ncbi:pre-rRNA-processing protein ESF2 [Artemisia annua]|uniref:Pre-rRNA-processing protein ESF2 n=1 Tax=Artemisia annua TaxID=35608 RepID=A0A2U1MTU4_ARTAN|nr:pre-rRNA-processing protein ESF2 [Artemisia annua]
MSEEEKVELDEVDDGALEEMKAELEQVKAERKMKRKRRLLKEAAKADMRGVCYLSRIPPRMDPLKLRQILSQYAELERIYLTPEDPTAHVHRKKAGGYRGQGFTEGWVEFTNKNVAKRVASMLNGEQIGGKKKSQFYYDLWNIKYLSKFKWDHLTEEIAYKNATREQKLAMELSAAKKERDFYLAKVDQSRALTSIDERLKKKRKMQQANGSTSEIPDDQQVAKVTRHFPQTKPVTDGGDKQKHGLSKSLLAGVFGGSS